MAKVTISFTKNGKSSTVKVEEVAGQGCQALTNALEQRLGTIMASELTADYYERSAHGAYTEQEHETARV